MSLPLARKYRPKDFSELFGNKEEVKSMVADAMKDFAKFLMQE